jgi:hypothetical protein
MNSFEEKIKNLYYYEEWDFTTIYGFYMTFNYLIKPYFLSYEHFEKTLKCFSKDLLNGESKILQKTLLDTILKNKTEEDFKLKK